MMKIWILEIGEPLPLEKDVRLHRYGEFSRFLANQGHEVIWWSSTFGHAPKKHFARKDMDFKHGKVTLKLIHGPGYKKNVSFARIKHQALFAKSFLERTKDEVGPDLVFAPIPNIETAMAVNTYCQKNSIPYFVDIRDLWPDDLKNLAPPPLRFLSRILLHPQYLKMQKICSQAFGIIGTTRSYLDYGLRFAKRNLGTKDAVIPLGHKKAEVSPKQLEEAMAFWEDKGVDLKGGFVISFVGTIGPYPAIEFVIKAAKKLQEYNDIQFVFAGDGGRKAHYERTAKKLPNIFFPGWISASQMKALLENSSVGLAPYRSSSPMRLPNKPFEYMAHGLPVLSSIQKDLKFFLQDHDAGITYRAEDPDDLLDSILSLYRDRIDLKKKGENAKKMFLENFESGIIFEKAHKHIIKCMEKTF